MYGNSLVPGRTLKGELAVPTDTFFRLPESKRETLLRCARQEFARVPYPDASINRIIHSAGIPRGSFYMYFEDKSDLFLYLMDQFVDAFIETVCQLLEEENGNLFLAFQGLFDRLWVRCSNSCREGHAAEVITILRRNAGMPHTMAMGQSYGRRFLSQILPRLDRSILALEGDEELEHGLRILLSVTLPLLCEGVLAEDSGPIRARYLSYLTILKRGMLR